MTSHSNHDASVDVGMMLPREGEPETKRLFLNLYRNPKTGIHYPGMTLHPTYERARALIVNDAHFVTTIEIALSEEK